MILYFSGNCYSKVRDETEAMQKSMDPHDYNYDAPQAEVRYVYEGEDKTPIGKEYLVEVEKPRPSWWSKNLLNKSYTR